MKKGGNISIKLTNILKQTKECCDKKKCPKDVPKCKPRKGGRKKKESKVEDQKKQWTEGQEDLHALLRLLAAPLS